MFKNYWYSDWLWYRINFLDLKSNLQKKQHLVVWSLNKNYRRQPQFYDGQAITQVKTKLNSINLKQIKSQLQITTGGDDGRVRIYKQKVKNSSCSD